MVYFLVYLFALFAFILAFTFAPSCASPINTAESMVNTYAWMKATNSSSAFTKNVEQYGSYRQCTPLSAGPMLAEIKIRQVSTSIAMCPASILAKRRIIKANGFVKIPRTR